MLFEQIFKSCNDMFRLLVDFIVIRYCFNYVIFISWHLSFYSITVGKGWIKPKFYFFPFKTNVHHTLILKKKYLRSLWNPQLGNKQGSYTPRIFAEHFPELLSNRCCKHSLTLRLSSYIFFKKPFIKKPFYPPFNWFSYLDRDLTYCLYFWFSVFLLYTLK